MFAACMSSNSEETTNFDPTIQSEDIAFRRDELVACGRCGRSNGPNRLHCMYCGHALDIEPVSAETPVLRVLENWESGFNLIVPSGVMSSLESHNIAEIVPIDQEQANGILSSGTVLPIARVESARIAEMLAEKASKSGFLLRIISDDALLGEQGPVRLSGVEINDSGVKLIDFNTGTPYSFAWQDLTLIVRGVLASGKIDSVERRQRKRETTILAETTTSTDEPVFDLYLNEDTTGFRVHLAGFDYSCLGDQKTLLATKNMSLLIERLRTRATRLTIVDDYKRIRHLLTGIWDVESRKDPQGLQRAGFGKVEFGNVYSTNNTVQFTKFSRLQRLML
jgi:hypothetical protein